MDFLKVRGGERIGGTVYFSPPRLIIEVKSPVHQIVKFSEKRLLLYYPERNQAFEIISATVNAPPFWELFLLPSQKGYFLGKGFRLSEDKGSFRKYLPPPSIKSVDYLRVFYDKKNRPFKILSYKGKKLVRTVVYQDFKEYWGFPFPSKIFISFSKGKEEVYFSHFVFNGKFPQWVENFSLPKGVRIKREVLR